jgi:hypothetical protein
MKKILIWVKWVFILLLSYITVTCRHTIVYMTPYLMNHYLRKYLITIVCVLYYRRHHIFDVKTCFQQNRYVLYVVHQQNTLTVFVFYLF